MLAINPRIIISFLLVFLAFQAFPTADSADGYGKAEEGQSRFMSVREHFETGSWIRICKLRLQPGATKILLPKENQACQFKLDGVTTKVPLTQGQFAQLFTTPIHTGICGESRTRAELDLKKAEAPLQARQLLARLCEADVQKTSPEATNFEINDAPLIDDLTNKVEWSPCSVRPLSPDRPSSEEDDSAA